VYVDVGRHAVVAQGVDGELVKAPGSRNDEPGKRGPRCPSAMPRGTAPASITWKAAGCLFPWPAALPQKTRTS